MFECIGNGGLVGKDRASPVHCMGGENSSIRGSGRRCADFNWRLGTLVSRAVFVASERAAVGLLANGETPVAAKGDIIDLF